MLLVFTPMYDLDTNSYIRGGLSWDIYHNPFLNIFIALLRNIWSNAAFFVAVQCLFYAFASAFVTLVVLGNEKENKRGWLVAGISLAALEPVTTFYNLSLISESFFTSFLMLAIGCAILWLRKPQRSSALGLGVGLGFAFLCKLSALILLPLYGIFLLRRPWKNGLSHAAVALLPFLACYAFVYIGQKTINEGDLYTVEGRVQWDFSSALYQPAQHGDANFARFVHPYILREGQLVQHRELRRELSYLGYKDCVLDFEARNISSNQGINACDSIFGAAAQRILKGQFWSVEAQFVRDNFRFIHELNYLDYRFTSGLHYYYPQEEYQYLDSLMATHFALDLSKSRDRIPPFWTSLSFGNTWMPILWWLWWGCLICAPLLWWGNRQHWELIVLTGLTAIPLLFHLVYISYRPRFVAPYLVLILLLFLFEIRLLLTGRTSGKNVS